jgi:hypothetical protein
MGNLFGARLKDNMLELATAPQPIDTLPEGMKEGPFLFERNGIYYFTFPHVIENTEALVYGMGDNPLGPFEYTGIIMDEHPSRCWTNHQSILEYHGQWYLFYHHNDLSPGFDKNRSICADSLFFNEDGTIQKVVPTFRGVGVTQATGKIQVDRYSAISEQGASIEFLDTADTFKGWKVILDEKGAWIRYDRVDFGDKNLKFVSFKVFSETGGTIELGSGRKNEFGLEEVEIPGSKDWQVVRRKMDGLPSGIHNIRLLLKDPGRVEVDWIRFE